MSAVVHVYEFGNEQPSHILIGDNLFHALKGHWQQFPEGAVIYQGHDAHSKDKELAIFDERTAEYTGKMTGEFTVVVYPHDPITLIAVAVGVLAIAAAFLLQPKVPNVATGNASPESPNGKLGERENQARVGGMIPENFGVVRTTPDLIMQNYYYYINHVKTEFSALCMGVGRYDFDMNDVYEDVSKLSGVSGVRIEFYNPNQSPLNYRDNPFLFNSNTDRVRDTLWTVRKHGSVVGQKLVPTNTVIDFPSSGSGLQCVYTGGNKILRENNANTEWSGIVWVGDSVTLSNIGSPYSSTYTISAIDGSDLYLTGGNAWTVSSSANLDLYFDASGTARWSDWFTFDDPHQSMFYINVTAPQGLYKVANDGSAMTAIDVGFTVEFQAIDDSGNVLTYTSTAPATVAYPTITKTFTLRGSSIVKSQRAASMRANVYHTWLDPEQTGLHALGSTTDSGYVREAILHVYAENVDPSLYYHIVRFCNYDLTSGDNRYDQILVSSASSKYGSLTSWGEYIYNDYLTRTVTFTISGGVYKIADVTSPYENFDTLFNVGDKLRIVGVDNASFDISGIQISSFESTGGGTNNRMVVTGATWSSGLTGTSATVQIWFASFTPNSHKRPVWVTVENNSDSSQKIHMLIDYRKIRDVTVDGSGNPATISPLNTVTSGVSRPLASSPTTNNEKFVLNPCIHTGGGQRMRMRIRRNTSKTHTDTNVQDETVLDSVFGMSAVTGHPDFGNITMIHMETSETPQPTALKKRKLQVLATRKLQCRNSSGNYINSDGTTASETPDYLPTRRLDHILGHILTSDTLGNYDSNNIDWDSLYSLTDDLGSYFGGEDLTTTGSGYPLMPSSTQFNWTFDKDGMSVEEMLQTACASWFITPFRLGNKMKFKSEIRETVAAILFNHRNKMPNTEQRNVTFGKKENHDGVELDWINPDNNDVIETYSLPSTRTAGNPFKVEVVGIRSRWHAFLHVWRAWNKIRHQHTTVEFDALPEALSLVRGDYILCADNTRGDTMDGEILSINGSGVCTLSQVCDISGLTSPNIFLQLPSGTTQAIPITQGTIKNRVTLAYLPSESLITDGDYFSRTAFQIVGANQSRTDGFLVTQREADSNGVCKVQAANYDYAYYFADRTRWWFEPVSQSWTEKSPFQRNIIPIGGASIRMDGASLSVGRGYCYYATSSASWGKISPSNPLTLSENFTVSAWIRVLGGLTSATRYIKVFSSTGGTAFKFGLRQSGTTFYLHGSYTSGTEQKVETTFTVETTPVWHHIALTYSKNPSSVFDGTFKLYLDGALVVTRGAVDHHSSDNLSFAGSTLADDGWLGWIDDARLFKYTLNDAEIKRLFLTTKALTGTTKV